ncbi:MAG: hypothetical protein K2Y05_11035 [Hyphomicrobiaceae bacterium]|nr:hypothetical protein [Hyphomicrobiaceae bacterium]
MKIVPVAFARAINAGLAPASATLDRTGEHAAPSAEPTTKSFTDMAPGLALAVLVPALFWPAVIWAAAQGFGYSIPVGSLIALGGSIATFLSVVCGALMLRD